MGKHISRFARGAIMILKQMNYSLGDSRQILKELGFKLERVQLKYVRLYTIRSQNAIRNKIFIDQKSRGECLNEDTKRKIIEMFSQNNAKSIKKAAQELKIEAKYITAYLKSQNLLIKNTTKDENDHFNQKYILENIKDNIFSLLDEEPEWKECIIRILFPKIKFGQMRQFERYFISFTSEIKYSSIKFIGFREGEKFFGRGSYIYIKAIYNPLIFISFSFLEQFLMKDIPDKFFSSNPVIDVCRLKIFDSNPQQQSQNNKGQLKIEDQQKYKNEEDQSDYRNNLRQNDGNQQLVCNQYY